MAPLLQVFDMPISIAFYRDVLGFEVVATSRPEQFGWALLRLNGVELMLNTAYEDDSRPAKPDPAGSPPRRYRDLLRLPRCGFGLRIPSSPHGELEKTERRVLWDEAALPPRS